jgi:ketosteroid isomerase-like protein
MTIPMVSLDCVSAVMDKSMSVDMAQFGTEMLEEMIEDQPHLLKMLSFLLTHIIAEGKPEEVAAVDAVQTMAVVGVVFKAIKATIEAEEMEKA